MQCRNPQTLVPPLLTVKPNRLRNLWLPLLLILLTLGFGYGCYLVSAGAGTRVEVQAYLRFLVDAGQDPRFTSDRLT